MIVGAIGDDFTGSSDLGLMLAEGGMRTVQYGGVPARSADAGVQAGVVALKIRSVPVDKAVAQALAALEWLRAQGCERILWKVCSTFDSTPEGNIGPVMEALAARMGVEGAVPVCPAFPATGRTVYQGHLFVADRLLSESGMEHHPLNPMTDPDLRRWLARQVGRGVGHLPLTALRGGEGAARLAAEAGDGRPYVVADAVADDDLRALAGAARGCPLWTGGSGIALGLPALHGIAPADAPDWRGEAGRAVALCGSCSATSRAQVDRHEADGQPVMRLDPEAVLAKRTDPASAIGWATAQGAGAVPLIASSAPPGAVAAAQGAHGARAVADALEGFFAQAARMARGAGFARIVAAGGETSGAVVEGLGADVLEIGPKIDPGVPALRVAGERLTIALKSGNFGAPDFFAKAARVLA